MTSELIFSDCFRHLELDLYTIGNLAQVCKDFRDKSKFDVVAAGDYSVSLNICGAAVAVVKIYGNGLSIETGGDIEFVDYDNSGTIPEINVAAGKRQMVEVIRLHNGVLAKNRPMVRHLLQVCGIGHDIISVVDYTFWTSTERDVISTTVDGKDTYICDILCSRGYFYDTTAIIRTNCRNNTIKIGRRRIKCGKIRLHLGEGHGAHRYLLGMDLFTSEWSPAEIESRNQVLMGILLVVTSSM